MNKSGVRIIGTGSYLPERVVKNDELAAKLDTSDEWIRSRTGIAERRFASDDQATSDLAAPAARAALEAAGLGPDDVDLLLCATMTPDMPMPSLAGLLQRELGLSRAGGYDINSACSGFVHALTAGANYVRCGAAQNVVVVGAEKMTSITNPEDRSTAVIFGDGAGAAVLQACPAAEGDLLSCRFGLKGDDEVLVLRGGGSRRPPSAESLADGSHWIHMEGRATFRFAVKTFVTLIEETCADAGLTPGDLKLIVPHQVNMRIIEAACERAKVRPDDCVLNIERVGNTSAASVAIVLDEAVRTGRMARGDLILLVAFGGGLSWSSALLRW
ncbi:MAG: beta-ketoacyl-ACP synthase III [Planctomycetota bacterium]